MTISDLTTTVVLLLTSAPMMNGDLVTTAILLLASAPMVNGTAKEIRKFLVKTAKHRGKRKLPPPRP